MFEPALLRLLHDARSIAVLTGSGVSAESGVPTFRDAQTGLWARYRPEELATPQAFERDPRLVWDWYRWRRELIARAAPNPAHHALVRLARRPGGFTLITQNVDGLHQRAGSPAVIEFHGNIMRDRCSSFDCGRRCGPVAESMPRCRDCGALLRPDVVWFGEPIPEAALKSSLTAVAECDVFMSIGTSSLVYPAAGLAETAAASGAAIIEINPAETPLTSLARHVLQGPAGELLPDLVDGL